MARDDLITVAMPLAGKLVNSYLSRCSGYERLRDELEGEAMLKLVEAAASLVGRVPLAPPDAANYLAKAIWHGIGNHAETMASPLGPSARSEQTARAAVKSERPGLDGYGNATACEVDHEAEIREQEDKADPGAKPVVYSLLDDDSQEIKRKSLPACDALYEQIKSVCSTPRQQEVLRLRARGYRDNEIAELLNCSRQLVQLEREKIKAHYNETLQTLGA